MNLEAQESEYLRALQLNQGYNVTQIKPHAKMYYNHYFG
jgi:hypothetical protein